MNDNEPNGLCFKCKHFKHLKKEALNGKKKRLDCHSGREIRDSNGFFNDYWDCMGFTWKNMVLKAFYLLEGKIRKIRDNRKNRKKEQKEMQEEFFL